jgi:hypothetical protein
LGYIDGGFEEGEVGFEGVVGTKAYDVVLWDVESQVNSTEAKEVEKKKDMHSN